MLSAETYAITDIYILCAEFFRYPLVASAFSFVSFKVITVGSCFATVRFTTIHFYDPCRVGPNNPDLWHHCNNSSVLSLLSALLALFRCACVSSSSVLVQFF